MKVVDNLNIMDLLPGSNPTRLTMYSQNAVDALGKFNESRPELEKKAESVKKHLRKEQLL